MIEMNWRDDQNCGYEKTDVRMNSVEVKETNDVCITFLEVTENNDVRMT